MLSAAAIELARGPNIAVLTTIGKDGHPQTNPVWIDTDGEHLLVNTEIHRPKFKNVTRDPRVTVTVIDRHDPYRYVEVRGRVVGTIRGPEARAHIDRLSEKYLGRTYGNPIQSERIILVVEPRREVTRAARVAGDGERRTSERS